MKLTLRNFVFGLLLSTAGIAPAHAELSDNDRLLYRQAYTAVEANNWDQVWNLAKQASDPFPTKLLHWVELVRGGPGAQFQPIADFLAKNPDWPNPRIIRARAESQLQYQSDSVAATWLRQYPPVTLAGKLREADLMATAGHDAQATDRLREIWITSELSDVEERNFLDHYNSKLRAEDHAKRLDRLLWDGKESEARRMLPLVGLDQRALGAARLALSSQAPNAEHLLELVPGSLRHDPGLAFEEMRWYRRKGHAEIAIEMLDHPPADLVRPLAWAGERQLLARLALSDGNISVAYRLASQHGLSEGPAFGELEFFAGWVALRDLREPAKAYDHFVRLYNQSKMGVSKARGAYWAAKSALAMQKPDEAHDWFVKATAQPTAYYGQLAGAAIGEPSLARIQPEPEAKEDESNNFEARELVRAARDLMAMGDREDTKPFLYKLTESAQTPGDFVQVAKLAVALDRPDMALYAAKRAINYGVNLFEESYPTVPLPPGGNAESALVLAVSRQESAFDTDAVSKAGARGLMQIMPATAKKVAKDMDVPFSRDLLTQNRDYNVKLGRAYLDEMLGEFSGSYLLAVAAYNAGPARVHQWLNNLGDPRSPNTDVVDWVESVPIAETRDYVQRVLENLQIYRLRLGNRDLAFKLAADLKR